MDDTCSYFNNNSAVGKLQYGVCCVNIESTSTNQPPTIFELNEPLDSIVVKVPQQVILTNWPPTHPPLPTHGPDNTIPPLPTHAAAAVTSPHPTQWTIKTTKQPQWTQQQPTAKPITTPKPAVISPEATQCGAKNGAQEQERIVGGHPADKGEWPWIAALFNGGRQFCGGSLIDNIHILSAAHCVAQYVPI